MFKEKYKRDMENITPSDDALNKTKEKMLTVEIKKPSMFGTKQLVALAVCFLMIVGSFGMILLKSSPIVPDINNAGTDNTDVSGEPIVINSVTSYTDIFEKLGAEAGTNNSFYNNRNGLEEDLAEAPATEGDAVGDDKSSGSSDYSDTNNQVAGVQEADIIKTDGKYIYACGKTNDYYYACYDYAAKENVTDTDNKGRVYILSANNGQLDLVSTIKIRNDVEDTHYVLTEILLYGDTLVLIKSGYSYEEPKVEENSDIVKDYYYYGTYNYLTSVEVYDISDRANPVFQNELYQSGYYNSSRMVGSDLYIVTTHYVYNPDINKPESYVPYCSSYSSEYLIPAECIYVAEDMTNAAYTVITGIDVTEPDNHVSTAAVLGFSGTIYSSDSNIYIAAYRYNNIYAMRDFGIAIEEDAVADTADGANATEPAKAGDDNGTTATDATDNGVDATEPDKTDIHYANSATATGEKVIDGATDIYRFSIDNAVVAYAANGSIQGTLINQFSMDEYNDTFRIATTVYEYELYTYKDYNSNDAYYYGQSSYYNNLYILDEDLKVTGSLTGLAPNERIYSVRFDGEIGYVVTFRQVDPLFTIDLSDKTSPKVLSALKIPGFSSYMHPYGDGLLFGFGQDADETNGWSQGLKLSMFDISDKTNVTEQSSLKLGTEYYYSAAMYNHKAILVDAKKNLIGFPVEYYNYNYNNTETSYTNPDEYEKTEESYGSTEPVYTAKTGYVFYKYENGKFVLSGSIFNDNTNYNYQGLRGLYIGDYVYIFSENQFITSYDLETFTQVDSVTFNN
ncbi:MAG: hypothetical protein A2Y15_07060 [Clostridiales bacterium GWF2_36_10]|nr:MAG: hypothetical protein A2Y15_07060 [Clostridiales bacterium GWF2_36_10]HAN21355.1 hypothetical protein [Clostridiales bacterium]